MWQINPQQLCVFRFEQNNIIMQQKGTKRLLQYYQVPYLQEALSKPNPCLQLAIAIPTGIIYPLSLTNMYLQLLPKLSSPYKQYYQQQQVLNTFLPLVQCLIKLHQEGIVHGEINMEMIRFDQDGEVKLRDWRLPKQPNQYYQPKPKYQKTKFDDFHALGNMMLEVSMLLQIKQILKTNSSIQISLRKISQRYSRGLVLAVYLMIKKVQKFYSHIAKILSNNDSYIDSSQYLINLFKQIKGQKQLRSFNPTIIIAPQPKLLQIYSKTPVTTKKVAKLQDLQNKKVYEQVKKKPYQRVVRISEKNINFQLKKPDMALKKMSNYKFNVMGQDKDNQKTTKKIIKDQPLKFASPLKRIATISKKKIH